MFSWEFALEIMPKLLLALRLTIFFTVGGMALALIIGLAFALGRRSSSGPVSWVVTWFVNFVRSTPFLVQLYFLYYVLPNYGIFLPPVLTGLIGLGLHYGAYTSEVYRAGIDAVARGQWDAAIALNFSPWRKWTGIILPQAIRPMLPALGNYLISMFKETPLLSAITLVELLQTAKIIASYSFRFVEPLTLVGLLFLALSYPSAILVRRLEAHEGR